MKTIYTILSMTACLYLTSCTDSSQPPTSLAAGASDVLTKTFAAVQEAPISILKARESAKPGQNVTLKGVVMGSKNPFVDGRAAFILGDPDKLTSCNLKPDDQCATPWDVCCETPEDIKASIVTIQVVDANGKVLREPIRNVNGLKALSTVVVNGTVTDTSNADLLVLNAKSIEVKD